MRWVVISLLILLQIQLPLYTAVLGWEEDGANVTAVSKRGSFGGSRGGRSRGSSGGGAKGGGGHYSGGGGVRGYSPGRGRLLPIGAGAGAGAIVGAGAGAGRSYHHGSAPPTTLYGFTLPFCFLALGILLPHFLAFKI